MGHGNHPRHYTKLHGFVQRTATGFDIGRILDIDPVELEPFLKSARENKELIRKLLNATASRRYYERTLKDNSTELKKVNEEIRIGKYVALVGTVFFLGIGGVPGIVVVADALIKRKKLQPKYIAKKLAEKEALEIEIIEELKAQGLEGLRRTREECLSIFNNIVLHGYLKNGLTSPETYDGAVNTLRGLLSEPTPEDPIHLQEHVDKLNLFIDAMEKFISRHREFTEVPVADTHNAKAHKAIKGSVESVIKDLSPIFIKLCHKRNDAQTALDTLQRQEIESIDTSLDLRGIAPTSLIDDPTIAIAGFALERDFGRTDRN